MIVRTFAVGLLTTAWLLISFPWVSVKWFQDYVQNSPVFAFHLSMKTISREVASATGAEYYSLAIYLFVALGIGMAIAGTVYPVIEDSLLAGCQFLIDKGKEKFARKGSPAERLLRSMPHDVGICTDCKGEYFDGKEQ